MALEARERSGVPAADGAIHDGLLDHRGRIQDAQRVGDRRPRATDALGDTLLGQAEHVDEVPVSRALPRWR